MTVVNRVFDQAYNDLESPKTRALILELNILLRAFFIRLKVRRNRYKRFFEGSLGIEYELEFDSSSNATNASIRNELIKANGTNELEFLQLGRISVVEIEPTTPPTSAATTTQAAPSESASTDLALDSWIIVAIVASIILLMLLFIIIILAYKYRQEKRTGKENFYFNGFWEMENMGPTRANYTNSIYANTYTGGQANGSGLYANGNHEYANGSSGYANGKNPSRRDDEVVNEAYL